MGILFMLHKALAPMSKHVGMSSSTSRADCQLQVDKMFNILRTPILVHIFGKIQVIPLGKVVAKLLFLTKQN